MTLSEETMDETSVGTDYEALAGKFRPIFEQIKAGAVQREQDRQLPFEEIRWLKEAGFGAIRVPKKYGGGGASLPQFVELMTELAAADGNIPQALIGHFTFSEDRLNAHATTSQERWFERFVAGDLVGNAWTEIGNVNVGDVATTLKDSDAGLVVNGTKFYSTGSIFADWIDVLATRASDDAHVTALVPAAQDGVLRSDDWDGFGQRTTGSGTSVFKDAHVDPNDVIEFTGRFKYQTAFFQLILLSVLAGSAVGAASEVAQLAKHRKRVYTHGAGTEWNQDPLVQQTIGQATAQGFAATAIAVRSAHASQEAYLAHFGDDQEAELRANHNAELSSSQGQIVLVDLALEATGKVLNALGASGTSEKKRLDRFWRNARTVSSHNPVMFKQRIVGDWAMNQTPPPLVWTVGAARTQTDTDPKARE